MDGKPASMEDLMAARMGEAAEKAFLALVNGERAQAGLNPLVMEVHLNDAAEIHSDWMGRDGDFSHTGANGSAPRDRAEASGFVFEAPWRITENLGVATLDGQLDDGEIARLHQGLMDSPGHRANILDPNVTYMGVGVTTGTHDFPDDGSDAPRTVGFVTQLFGSTAGEALVQSEDADGGTVLESWVNGAPDPDADPVPDTPDPVDPPVAPPATPSDPDDDTDDDGKDDDKDKGRITCFVATAAYGDGGHPDVVTLRRLRDDHLVKYAAGRGFIRAYWVIGPVAARFVRSTGQSGRVARAMLAPIVRGAARITGQR